MSETMRALLEPLDPARVKKDYDGFSHLAAWDVRAHMNRILGFGNWDARVVSMEQIDEIIEGDGPRAQARVTVAYRACCEVRVRNTDWGTAVYQEWAAGAAKNHPWKARFDAHDMAMKTAASQAFKRCCMNLGDQFGLSLYDDGSTAPVVREVVGVDAHADNERVQQYLTAIRDATTAEELTAVGALIRLHEGLTEGELRALRGAWSEKSRLVSAASSSDGEEV